MNLEQLIAYYQAKLTNPVLTQESRVIAKATLRELEKVSKIGDVIGVVNTPSNPCYDRLGASEGFEEIESILEEES